ncbi:MAG: type II secretion system minor pseudopilin GspK [Geobacteraceae bacterium]|nr:type II secretion system minor pseudopilin GspK [Geobacteraceae bacterium]
MTGERGFALVITLIVTALLVVVTTEFIHDVFIETSMVRGYQNAQQASLLAESGVQGGVKVLKMVLSAQEYTSLLDGWAAPQAFQDERGSLQVSIVEESGKLDINSIVFPNGTLNEAYYGTAMRLLEKLRIPTNLCDALADWIDTDDSTRGGGAETVFYQALPTPYKAKNDALETYEEMRMVSGFDDTILGKLHPFVTVYAESKGSPYSKVNVNTAPVELLAVLDEQMTDELAGRIVEYRSQTPINSPSEITQIAGLESIGIALQGKITTKGSVFRIQSRAQVGDTVRIIEAVVRVVGTESTVLYWREL